MRYLDVKRASVVIGVFLIGSAIFTSPVGALTMGELVELLIGLGFISPEKAQIAREVIQSNTGSVSVTTPPSGGSSCLQINRNLGPGSSGADVSALQKFLAGNRDIYPQGQVSGYYGSLTQSAVERFQIKYGIVSSGLPDTTGFGAVGPLTRSRMLQICNSSSSGVTTPVTGTIIPINPVTTYAACQLDGVAVPHGTSRIFYLKRNPVPGETCLRQERTCSNGILSGGGAFSVSTCTEPNRNICVLDGVSVATGDSGLFYSKNTVLSGQSCSAFSKRRLCGSNGKLEGDETYIYGSCGVTTAGSCTLGGVTLTDGESKTFYSAEETAYNVSCSQRLQIRACIGGVLTGNDAYQYTTCEQATPLNCSFDGATVSHGQDVVAFNDRYIAVADNCGAHKQTRTCTNGNLSGNANYRFRSCSETGSRTCFLDGVYTSHGQTRSYFSRETVPLGQACSSYAQVRKCDDGSFNGGSGYQYASCTDGVGASCTVGDATVNHNTSVSFYSQETATGSATCSMLRQTRTCFDGVISGNTEFRYTDCSED